MQDREGRLGNSLIPSSEGSTGHSPEQALLDLAAESPMRSLVEHLVSVFPEEVRGERPGRMNKCSPTKSMNLGVRQTCLDSDFTFTT